jgi:short-subunit dehydrogenase
MSIERFISSYGPIALVTGASSGIGRAFAEILASKKLDLVLVARRVDRLQEVATRLTQRHGVAVTLLTTDLAQPQAAGEVLEATASLDIGLVVSNAGFGARGDHASLDPATLADMLMVNCQAPMLLSHGFIPRLRARKKGGFIFTSSVEALIGMPNSAAYAATKGFVNQLGEGLWAELGPDGIDVLTICPGATDTEALQRSGVDRASMQNVMSPEEVAALALENIANGPIFLPSAHYKAMFDRLLSMPRRDALAAMAVQNRK